MFHCPCLRWCADPCSYAYWARKAEGTSSSAYSSEPVHDDEPIEFEDEDEGQHAMEPSDHTTNVPLPLGSDATKVSVDQLSALTVEPKDEGAPTTGKPTEAPSAKKDDEAPVVAQASATSSEQTTKNKDDSATPAS